jgi:HAD superfamily hydrolase (TIGR01509 family)
VWRILGDKLRDGFQITAGLRCPSYFSHLAIFSFSRCIARLSGLFRIAFPCGFGFIGARLMAIRGVIFDMDGTITAPYFNFVKIKEEAGIGDIDMLDYLRYATGAEYDRIQRILVRFEEAGVCDAKLNRGARTVLRFLARQRIPTALLTRNSRLSVDGICRKLKLNFDICVSREDGPHKPAPEAIWQIAKRWGFKPSEVLMVGDYKWDVLCAQNAGAPCAVLVNGDEVPDWANEAEYPLRRLTDLISILK